MNTVSQRENTSSVFALVDCNNFFVSCERLFKPGLAGKPVVVLSSNDGCAIARSNEAKALGIPMGAPAFKYRELFRRHNVISFSANFGLYGDISFRITQLLTSVTPRTEVYSIDESFLDISQLKIPNREQWGRLLKDRVEKEVGIPVSVGFASSKLLAKLATERAKKSDELRGVLDLTDIEQKMLNYHLAQTPIENVWGVGRRLAPKLRAQRVFTALDLKLMRTQLAGQLMGVHGRQMIAELHGICAQPLQPFRKPRKTIMSGRIFGADTNNLEVIEAAISNLATKVTAKLRREKLMSKTAVVMLDTNRHRPGYIRLQVEVKFDTPTNDAGQITSSLLKQLELHFNSSSPYHRANILLLDLVDSELPQIDLLGYIDLATLQSSQARTQALDAINDRYGQNTLRYAASDLSKAWRPKSQHLSPNYTTSWNELPVATIKP